MVLRKRWLLGALALAGCAHQQDNCYDRQSCFQADQARRDRGVAMMGIGAGLLQPPVMPVYQPQFQHPVTCTPVGSSMVCR